MPNSPPNAHSDGQSAALVERDRYTSGALQVVAFADPKDPAGELARLRLGIGLPDLELHAIEMNRTSAMELGLTLIAFANGNWVDMTDTELEVRHGQLRLELEALHG